MALRPGIEMKANGTEVMTSTPLVTAFLDLAPQIASLDHADCPALIGVLEQLKAMAWIRLTAVSGDVKPETKLTMQQVAERLNIPDSSAYELARQGKIQSVRIGKYIRVTEGALKTYEASLGVKSA